MGLGGAVDVAVFVYNREEHAMRTLKALAKNDLAPETAVHVFSDGPKREEDVEKVERIRKMASEIKGFRSVELISRRENYGLARNIIEGVSMIAADCGRVIVLEDDLVTNRYFLRFMNDALERYRDEPRVTGITGFSHFSDDLEYPRESYFNTLTGTSWSWATWSDRWDDFDPVCADWVRMKEDAALRRAFNYDNTYDFYKIMKMQQTGEGTDSWAIRWYWSNFRKNGLILSPARSLVKNVGWDGSGVHCGKSKKPMFNHNLMTDHPITDFPKKIRETEGVHKAMMRALINESQPNLLKRYYHKIFRRNYIGQA